MYFDDFTLNETFQIAPVVIDKDEMLAFAGDELTAEVVVTGLTERNEKNGIVEITFYVKNQKGDLVLTDVTEMIVKRRFLS